MVEMNALLQQLSPAPLEKVGLVQALRDQCEALSYRTGAQVTTDLGELPPNDRLPVGASESIFRIVQEAFSNIARHARAGQVILYLGLHDDKDALILRIQDDGQGFNSKTAKNGMGLDNIRQRVRALGGELAIESDPGQGTIVRANVPVIHSKGDEKENSMKLDHTLNKIILAGVAGGLALISVLFYPLYSLLPGSYIDEWTAGSQVIGLALEVAAALVATATGFAAARWARSGSRQSGTLFGALAGGVAGVILYLGIGAAAAGLAGQGAVLQHGLAPAAGDSDLAQLAIGATVGTIWWTYAALWAALLGGIGLGAIGGLLAPIATNPTQYDPRLAIRMMLVQSTWFSILILLFSILIFPVSESSILDRIVNQAIPPEAILPPQGFSLWPVGSAAVFCLVPMATLYFLLRGEIGTKDPIRLHAMQTTAAVFGLIAAGMGFLLLIPILVYSQTPLGALLIGTATVSLVLGGGYLAAFIKVRRQRQELGLIHRPHAIRIIAAVCVLWSLGMIAWGISLPLGWGALAGLIVAAVDVVLLLLLRRQPRQPTSDAITLQGLQTSLAQMINASLGTIVAIIVPVLANIGAGTSLTMILVRLIILLADYSEIQPSPDFTMIQLVRDAYLAQGRVAIVMLVGAVATVGLLMLAISGIITLTKHRVSKDD
jgi:hypothetical protein